MSDLREEVRTHYATVVGAVALGLAADDGNPNATCCAPEDGLGVQLYDSAERSEVPEEAVLASLGCGNPTAVAELRDGEVVLDLGSGGGIDVLLSAQRVGPTGKAFGLDMTKEMLDLARANAERAGATNVEFLEGYIEDVPLPDETVDVVISNCVINLSTDKPTVLAEMHRVLRRGGRLGISDVVSVERAHTRRAGRTWQPRRLHRGSALVRGVHAGTEGCGVHGNRGHADARVDRRHVRGDRAGS